MKKTLCLICSFLLALTLCAPTFVFADTLIDGDWQYTVSDGTATVRGYHGSGGNVVIPMALGGYPVKAIGEEAFRLCGAIASVGLPEGLETIGDHAFDRCSDLEWIALPQSLRSIGDFAFYLDANLTGISFAENGSLTAIGSYAFTGCSSFTNLSFPSPLAELGVGALAGCTGLTGVSLPETLINLYEGVFDGCESLSSVTVDENNPVCCDLNGVLFNKDHSVLLYYPMAYPQSSYAVPDGVTMLYNNPFAMREGLKTLSLPDTLTTVSPADFSGAIDLKSILVSENHPTFSSENGVLFNKDKSVLIAYPGGKIGPYIVPDSVTSFYEPEEWEAPVGAFQLCEFLTQITIPASVAVLPANSFVGCSALLDVQLANGVCEIGDYAFSGCTSLSAITIPASVTRIGTHAFSEDYSLNTATILGSPELDEHVFSYLDDDSSPRACRSYCAVTRAAAWIRTPWISGTPSSPCRKTRRSAVTSTATGSSISAILRSLPKPSPVGICQATRTTPPPPIATATARSAWAT